MELPTLATDPQSQVPNRNLPHCTPLLSPCDPNTIGDSREHETEEPEKPEEPEEPERPEEPEKPSPLFSLYSEATSLAHIALPTVFVQFCQFSIYPQCASVIGRRLDTESLAAFSLGSLSANMTCTSIIIGTLSASETLQPRAFALKRHEEVGRLAVRGFFVCLLILLLPMFFLFTRAEEVFNRLDQDVEAGHLASEWIQVYIWSVVPLLAFRVARHWLASQNVVLPGAFAAGIGCFVVHPLVVRWAVAQFGFVGSASAIVITQTTMCVLCIAYVGLVPGSYERSTWAGLSPSAVLSSLRLPDLVEYARLGVGGVFTLSEWWFWDCICFLAGKFGVVEVCVHTIAYQSIQIAFMVPLGVSIGLGVRIGHLLPVDVDGAKRLAAWTMGFTTVGACLVSAGIYRCREWIVSMFTTDEEVEEGCRRIWFSMCVYNVLLWYFCVSRGILSALGLQWRTAANTFGVLWVLTIPAIVYSCVYEQKGYYYMWKMVPLSYTILDAGLTITYMSADWEAIGARIKLKRKSQD